MSEYAITDQASALAVVKMVKNQIKNETGKYLDYVQNNGVVADTVADHVKLLREMAYPGIKADGRADLGTPERNAKRFADKVRMGLRTAVGDRPSDRAENETDWAKRLTNDTIKAVEAGLGTSDVMAAVEAALASLKVSTK